MIYHVLNIYQSDIRITRRSCCTQSSCGTTSPRWRHQCWNCSQSWSRTAVSDSSSKYHPPMGSSCSAKLAKLSAATGIIYWTSKCPRIRCTRWSSRALASASACWRLLCAEATSILAFLGSTATKPWIMHSILLSSYYSVYLKVTY